MKNLRKILLILLLFFTIPNTYAKDIIKDGWHIVKSTDGKKNVWGYYENGSEIMRKTKMVYAHRGWGTAPENSLASIKATKEKGYYGVEIDVRFTKDNVPVLLHDSSINRVARTSKLKTLSKRVYIKNVKFSSLKKYSFSVTRTKKVLSNYKNNKITTFEEALVYLKNNKMTAEIELKVGTSSQIKSLVQLVKKYNMDNVVQWISFNPTLLKYVKNNDDNEWMRVLESSDLKDRKKIYDSLKTSKNIVDVPNYKSDIAIDWATPNMPENEKNYNNASYDLTPLGLVQIKSLEIVKIPNKIEYLQYKENLDLSDGQVKITYINNTTKVVNMNDSLLTVSNFDNTKSGKQTITIKCADENVSFDVNVIGLTEIKLTKLPSKLLYLENEELVKDGIIELKYEDRTEEIDMNNPEVTFTGFDNTNLGKQTITVNYHNLTTSFDIEVYKLQEIMISKTPSKLLYIQNKDDLIKDGTIKLVYSNNETNELEMSNTEIILSGFDNSTIGKQTITVSYHNLTTSFDIEIIKPEAFTISTLPSKLLYLQNEEELDLTGGTVSLTNYLNEVKTIEMNDSEITVSGFDNTILGEQTITLTYLDLSISFNIEIVWIENINIKTLPTKLTYQKEKDDINLNGGIIEITYNNGKKENIKMTDSNIKVKNFDNTIIGKQKIIISYFNYETSFDIEIIEKNNLIILIILLILTIIAIIYLLRSMIWKKH